MDSGLHLTRISVRTNLLAERLQGHPDVGTLAVLNAGIGGNRILHDIVGPSGLSSFDRDALVQSGGGRT